MTQWRGHYERGLELGRFADGAGRLEEARTKELLQRHLPPGPATVYDVGGGPGIYAHWLSGLGYQVHLIDPIQLHVDEARTGPVASAAVGDASNLPFPDHTADALLLLGPLYHLVEAADRRRALDEARRVLQRGGLLFAAAISRYASTIDGLHHDWLGDPDFETIVQRDLAEGQHRNPGDDPRWFTTAYFHRPEELRAEVQAAGFHLQTLVGIEGPAWRLPDLDDRWQDPTRREHLLQAARWLESEPSILGYSPHLMAIATNP